jgi:copper(I)-binding protein
MLQAGRLWVQFLMRSLKFFNLSNPSSHIMILGFTQHLKKMSTTKCFWGVKHGPHIRLTTSLGTMLQAGRLWVQFLMRSLRFFNLSNPSSHIMILGFTQHLKKMSTIKCFWGVKHGPRVRLTTSPP